MLEPLRKTVNERDWVMKHKACMLKTIKKSARNFSWVQASNNIIILRDVIIDVKSCILLRSLRS